MDTSIINTGIGAVAGLATDLIDRAFPDKEKQAEERAQYMLQATQLDDQLAQAQIAVNQQEAGNENIFVSGWRPFIGWVCGLAFAYHLIFQPFLAFVMAACGHSFPLPDFDTATLNTTLMGLLGLGTLRTVEKVQAMTGKKS